MLTSKLILYYNNNHNHNNNKKYHLYMCVVKYFIYCLLKGPFNNKYHKFFFSTHVYYTLCSSSMNVWNMCQVQIYLYLFCVFDIKLEECVDGCKIKRVLMTYIGSQCKNIGTRMLDFIWVHNDIKKLWMLYGCK